MKNISRMTALATLLALSMMAGPAWASDRNGGVVEIHLGGVRSVTTTGLSGGFDTGIFGGYRLKRFIFGLGFDLLRGAQRSGATDQTNAVTFLLFSPGVRVALVRSPDHRVELFGFVDVGFGTALTSSGSPTPTAEVFRFAYQVGPGVRFWAHPQFSIAGAAGVRGDFQFELGDPLGNGASAATTSIFGQLQLLAVF